MSGIETHETQSLRHVAIVMDGNGRWAKARGLPRVSGHAYGVEAVRRLVRGAQEMEIPFLTLFGFSSENWQRPKEEVDNLVRLLDAYLDFEVDELANVGIRLRLIGDLSRLPETTLVKVKEAERRTRFGRRLTLTIAFGYGGRDEIVAACRRLARRVEAGELKAADVTPERFALSLSTAGLPDPDLLIRTGGEVRISNFLLWQLAYTELYFTPVLWPDFDRVHLERAVAHFRGRERTFGKVDVKAAGIG